MEHKSVGYWNSRARTSLGDAIDAILYGYRSERAFDRTGRVDAAHLILPFVSRKDVVLDVGCGIGRLLKWVAPHVSEAIGIDVSMEMLAHARRRLAHLRNVRFRRLPVSLRFPFGDRTLDFAYFYHVSEHLEREDTFRILSEIRRCLHPEGKALIQVSLLDHAQNQREFRKWARLGDPESVRSRFYTEPEALTLLSMARFYPQVRLFIPGEYVVVVTKQKDIRRLGDMPLVSLYPEPDVSRNGRYRSRW
jgi:SAM-dependent methyltransferase